MADALSLSFDPLLPGWLLAVLATLAAALGTWGLVHRAKGAWWRLAFFAGLIAALADPHLVRETRGELADIAVALVDRSASNRLAGRAGQADAAVQSLRQAAEAAGVTLELVDAGARNEASDLFAPLASAMAEVPPERLSAALLVSDGRITDAERAGAVEALGRPVHALLTGDRSMPDRRVEIVRAPEYALVDRPVTLEIRIAEDNIAPAGPITVTVRRQGRDPAIFLTKPGALLEIPVMPQRRGRLLVEVEAEAAPGETVLVNNRALFSLNAVRDRLRVLLVSGEPHPGERVWRDILKSDPAVDLIHFTILRLPTSQDPTPVSQLSLIPFPTERLFADQIGEFDLIIFDRYTWRGVLEVRFLNNLLDYVREGGAILASNGPEFAQSQSLYGTVLADILPAAPSGEVILKGFAPTLTDLGRRHPVTETLAGRSMDGTWGRWFRLVESAASTGQILMTGAGEHPLLILSRVAEGRVAQLMSDQVWLWARDVEGGGPHRELLRRTVHWLMKEPDLEEEALSARAGEEGIVIERRSLEGGAATVSLTAPDGSVREINLAPTGRGTARAVVSTPEPGLYSLSDGRTETVVGVGPVGGHELSEIVPTEAAVAPLAQATGGGVFWLGEGMPGLRRVSEAGVAAGRDWLGLPRRQAYRTESLAQQALLPAWGWLLVIGGLLSAAWRAESA